MRVMTFNIRVATAPDGANGWEFRKQMVVERIRAAKPDLLGLQECLALQADFLRTHFESEYHFIGVHREDGKRQGEASTVLVRKSKFDLLESNTFWLSETPGAVGIKGWDADLARVCTWARVRDRETGCALHFLNTHFDHRGVVARNESAKQIASWISSTADLPAILTGDFNADGETSEPHQHLSRSRLQDVWRFNHPAPIEQGTFHEFTGTRTRERIDWILCTEHFKILDCTVDYSNESNRYPSDHFPVIADLQLT